MTVEKPQKGNPHQLVVRQHVFPVASIERFCSARGTVEVQLSGSNGKVATLKPKNVLFCAQRAWDNLAETGRFKRIEDVFQPIASKLVGGALDTINSAHAQIVSEFFALCYYRAEFRDRPMQDRRLEVLAVRRRYSQDEAELLEANGYISVRPDGTLAGRHFASIGAHFLIGRMRRYLSGMRWRVVRSPDAEFLVPDHLPELAILPVAPNVCLCGGNGDDGVVDASGVRALNALLVAASRRYYFARKLTNCPT